MFLRLDYYFTEYGAGRSEGSSGGYISGMNPSDECGISDGYSFGTVNGHSTGQSDGDFYGVNEGYFYVD